ncbi:Enhancer of polycomb-like protein 1 [Yarrowia sp. C11]|nr:Enhancer of polycomb-like protein 1 [Yarrowia sp. E02]KAG5372819.1 Enhancer of polycomb-like protein 1 [Yarrowia sp. C11]
MAKAAKAAGSSARFRQRKISVKQTLAVLKQSDIPDLEEEQQRELQQIETGVEKGEEEEHHLQAAINSSIAQSTGAKVEKIYIPTPDASQVWKEYDRFYTSSFQEPASYIRTSVTVEETSGCLYNMDDEDAEFLKTCKPSISEDDFEEVMHRFEVTISEKQPFVSIDVSNLLSFEEMAQHIEDGIRQVQEDPTSPEYILAQLQSSLGITVNGTRGKNEGKAFLATFKKIGAVIYPHWRARKVERKGQSIVPHLKFEDHEKDDSDPYVCFRRRELRQVRKTRRTDVLSIERLRRMQAEMETAKQLVEMVATREFTRKAALKAEWDVFEDRCAIKALKRELGIKGEDEDLVAQKKRKVEPKKEEKAEKASTPVRGGKAAGSAASAQAAAAQAAAAGSGSPSVSSTHVPPNVSIPPSKIPNMDLITIAQVVRDKDEAIAKAVREKLRLRADADRDWHNLTNSGYIPYCEYLNAEVSSTGEPPVPQYSSINEMSYFEKHNASHKYTTKSDFNKDIADMVGNKPFADAQVYGAVVGDNGELRLSDATASSSPVERVIPRASFMSMRKRIGRGGRVWMDRRGLQRNTVLKPSSLAKNSLDDIAESEVDQVAMERLADRLKYDRETEPTRQMSSYDKDPSQLNGISSDTQSIRFGSMLLSKAYENYREVFQQRQQQLMMLQQQILQQQQQQQMRNRQQSHPPGDPGANLGGGHGAGAGPGGSRNNSPAPGANGPQPKMHNGAPMGYNKQGMTPSQHQQYQQMQQQQQQQQQRKMGVAHMNAASAAAAMAAQPRRASGSPDGQRFNGLPNGGGMANGVLPNGMGQRMMPGGDMKQKSELAKVDA